MISLVGKSTLNILNGSSQAPAGAMYKLRK